MGGLGVPELLIILAIVIAIFGVGKLAGIGGALGGSIREFRKSVREDEPTPAERIDRVERVDRVERADEPRDTTRV